MVAINPHRKAHLDSAEQRVVYLNEPFAEFLESSRWSNTLWNVLDGGTDNITVVVARLCEQTNQSCEE